MSSKDPKSLEDFKNFLLEKSVKITNPRIRFNVFSDPL